MITEVLPFSEDSAKKAAEIMAAGGIVGIPTETVYGLAADARNEAAVRSIFAAKGRPQDNPLIVHISNIDQLPPLVRKIPTLALELAERFWGGPLTMIFPKSDLIPQTTSGGLDTIAVRMPSSPAARAIIDACGFPLAAPSANLSGSPSPTTAQHVFNDMNGRIPLIIDGGECSCGVESTVLCFTGADRVRVLRPGGVTAEMLSELCTVDIDPAVTAEPEKGAKVLSPGMKYKHYSPKADVLIVNAHGEQFRHWCEAHSGEGVIALSQDGNETGIFRSFGEDTQQQAHRLFALLREADEQGTARVYVEMPSKEGIGLAVYNRLLRAAAFRIVSVDDE
ncbi:MAG: L-threonylcarbamoyladenylate synthase [Oscillospiraceae bacterium]